MDTSSLRSAILAITIWSTGLFGSQLVVRASLALLFVICSGCRELFSAVCFVVEDHVARRTPDVCTNRRQSHVGWDQLAGLVSF